MFTVKVYWSRDVSGGGLSHFALHECEQAMVENEGITLYNDGKAEAWFPRPELPGETEHRTGERPDSFVSQIIIENAAGQTTEIIRA